MINFSMEKMERFWVNHAFANSTESSNLFVTQDKNVQFRCDQIFFKAIKNGRALLELSMEKKAKVPKYFYKYSIMPDKSNFIAMEKRVLAPMLWKSNMFMP